MKSRNTLDLPTTTSYHADAEMIVNTWDDGTSWIQLATNNGSMKVVLTKEQLIESIGMLAMALAAINTDED